MFFAGFIRQEGSKCLTTVCWLIMNTVLGVMRVKLPGNRRTVYLLERQAGSKSSNCSRSFLGGKDNSSMDTVIPATHNRDLSGQVAGILTERVVGDLLLKDRRPPTDGSVPYVFF